MSPQRPPKKRSSIGTDPLDSMLTPPKGKGAAKKKAAPKAKRPKKASARTQGKGRGGTGGGGNASPKPPAQAAAVSGRVDRQRVTFMVDSALMEQVRDVAYWLSGPPEQLTLREFAEEALSRELVRLKRKHKKSHPDGFPPRGKGKLKGGRPISS